MRILAVDIGTGTQDILLLDTERPIENSVQLVLPSPTAIVAEKIKRCTAQGRAIVLVGDIMGGGPCAWAADAHLKAGLPLYATPEAARTFDDDLDRVAEMGVNLLSAEQAQRVHGAKIIPLYDLSIDSIFTALKAFDISVAIDGLAVAVFDHGNAPPNVSDRAFRFDYLARRLREGKLTDLAFPPERIPHTMTRLRAVARSAPEDVPLLMMDTAPAAILGALIDPAVKAMFDKLVVNIGNFHTLAFHLVDDRLVGLFEHHTGEITAEQLEDFLDQLAVGTLTNEAIFDSQGHGALIFTPTPDAEPELALIGPRQKLLARSRLMPHHATPHGSMMMAGCYGLLAAYAAHHPSAADEINAALEAGSV